jgi:hypothetical protein
MSEEWRTDEPEVGQVARLMPIHWGKEDAEKGNFFVGIARINPSSGNKQWDVGGHYWRVCLLQWLPITTPEEERLRARVRELEEGIERHKKSATDPMDICDGAADKELWQLIETEAGGVGDG